ncbi:MAG: glycosyltransferase family A protein [Promethearchaeota archaeon]|jgi:glycosyltransferase involved in cell wall biosynthesis
MLKIQILFFYFERPQFLNNILESLRRQKYENWELHVIDDGEKYYAEDILTNSMSNEELNKTSFYRTNDTSESKKTRGGSIFGKFANLAMKNSQADITFMLCDDDAIYDNYLFNLNNFYSLNPNIKYSYSHISSYNPLVESPINLEFRNCHLNLINNIHPSNRVDASQVSWRRKISLENGLSFPYPQTANLDSVVYKQLFLFYGFCVFNGFVSQYKGFHSKQLMHKANNRKSIDKWYKPNEE